MILNPAPTRSEILERNRDQRFTGKASQEWVKWFDALYADAIATTAALGLYQLLSEKNAASGYAGLDASSKLTGSQQVYGTTANTAAQGNDSRLSDARTPTAHKTTHEPGGSDAMAVDAAAATGSLRTIGTGALQATAGNDTRLSDARTPTAHATSHQSGGSDALTGQSIAGLLTTSTPQFARIGLGGVQSTPILTIYAPSITGFSGAASENIRLYSTDAVGADLGPSFCFAGASGGGSTPYPFASIAGRKDGATAYLAYLHFLVTGAGGAIAEMMRLSSTGIGFFATAPAVKQTSGANLTNNVTAGGTTDTIANYTDLVTYANDAAAIRNDIYQLSRKLQQVNDGLRLYGLFT